MIGSWTEGMVHFQKLAPYILSFEKAYINATVYRLPVGFPVIVNQENQKVYGQLIEIKVENTLLALMDTLHGVYPTDASKGLHIRSEIEVIKISGGSELSQVYFFNPKKITSKAVLLQNAEWRTSLEEQPPLPQTLTEKQRTYVLKLGAAKGRDIVPIQDLSLYRELMKLELIVDKGRRLALSNLGKEVYNHLV
ncbi:MAG: gamma-glutamylcyclotransferase [Bdellovibrionaceae bacterium]|nr:gamma-glutamylcyclotransferase [Pseudobdellovibrionaceae bacterium]